MLFGLRAVCLASLYCSSCSGCLQTFQPASKPFSELSNRSAWFINRITLLCIIESGPTCLKTEWPIYKLVKFAIGLQHIYSQPWNWQCQRLFPPSECPPLHPAIPLLAHGTLPRAHQMLHKKLHKE